FGCYAADDIRKLISGVTRTLTCSTRRSQRISASATRMQRTSSSPACSTGSGPWIGTLPDGTDTRSDPIAWRALAANGSGSRWTAPCSPTRRVLILDEPTAHLNKRTGRAILAEILVSRPNKATLLIAHDFDSLHLVDEILMLDRFRIA